MHTVTHHTQTKISRSLISQYIQRNGGIESESSYPYQGEETGYCQYHSSYRQATATGYQNIPQGDENALMVAVANYGPVAVAIDATNLQYYKGATQPIYYDPNCSGQRLNHAVLVTGYGTTSDGYDYWIVKNSWGTSFGKNGYFWLVRGINHCGVANAASFPSV